MSLYRCSFCKDPLDPMPPYKWQWLLLLVLTRNYSCPHCREMYLRPSLSLKNLFGRRREDGRKSTNTKGWTASPGSIRVAQPESGDESKSGRSRRRRSRSSGSREDVPEPSRDASSQADAIESLSAGEQSERRMESVGDSEKRESDGRKSKSRRSSGRSTRIEKERRDLKRRDAVISTLSNQSRPNSYKSSGLLARSFRKVRRRVRKLLGLSSRKKTKRSY